jgi:tetratricopeptide (TPR) repeat protein
MRNGIEHFVTEHRRLVDRLAGPLPPEERHAVRQEIIALFRSTEQAIEELTAFKETIRELVERFKALPEEPAATTSVVHDHLGASTMLEQGWSALARGEWTEAEALLEQARRLDPEAPNTEALLGWALMHQGRGDDALQHCLSVLLRDPENGLARTAVGAICLQKGIAGEAIEHLTRVVRHGSDPRAVLYARYWLGVAYLERDMPRDAVDALQRAVAAGPNLAEAWAELGRALWRSGLDQEARSAWERGSAIRFSPFAERSRELMQLTEAGRTLPRSPLP